MSTATLRSSSYPRPLRTNGVRIAAVFAIAAFTFGVLGLLLSGLMSWELLVFLLACTGFVGMLVMARPYSGVASIGSKKAFLASALVIWMFLMASEGIFIHLGTTSSAVGGHFDATAYYEAGSWILSLAALAFITCFRPAYLRLLFSGPLKWASIFAIIVVISCPLSPGFAYSLAQAFKLCVVVLTLIAINEAIDGEAGISKLFSALFAGILVLTIAGFITPFVAGGPVFNGARFGALIGLSGTAGILLLLSFLFWLLKKNPWFLVAATFALVLMILVGGKGGILASVLSFIMFFLLLKRAALALAACAVITGIFLLLVAFTPVGDALQRYGQTEDASTLTGRTQLWTAVWPEIKHRPIFGHGYRASRFVSEEVEGAFAEAGHIHNVFLEILYNNGVVGLLVILVMNFSIIANLQRAIRRPATTNGRYFASAALALYIHLLLWGVTAPTFGSTADSRFMTFFAILLISIFLKAQSTAKPELAV